MEYENINKLTDEHFGLLERLYGMSKSELLSLSKDELLEILFFDEDSPLLDTLADVDDDGNPLPDMLLAEQIYDILLPPEIYHP